MWKVLGDSPRGRISQRNLPLLATGLLVAIFVCIFSALTTFAADIIRTTDGFAYNGHDYNTVVTISAGDPRNLTTDQPVTAYEYKDDAAGTAEYIYFPSGTDPQNATSGAYISYKFTPPDTYAQLGSPQSIPISTTGVTPSPQNASNSCTVGNGTGWIICPVGNTIASWVDGLYGVVMAFMDVKPMLTGGPLYDVWNAIRSLANLVFVAVFLVVIFSQVTSLGISTYGIRKALPRLVIAAILVNVSYLICALAIDLSNFLGHSVYSFIYGYAQSLNNFGATQISWADITTALFGASVGGSLLIGGIWFSVATGGSLAAAIFTLFGMLISLALSLIVAMLILVSRQALLVIFTLISPFAFVALVLPSTEKWFSKWREAGMTLLIMFPLFSLVFAGSLLAGGAIILSAGGNLFIVLLGKAVQVIPLAITPLIVKFSTGILGTVARLTNDRRKGLVDRARNWTGTQAEHHRKKSVANRDGRRYNPFRWTAQQFDNVERRQKREQEGFEAASAARAQSTRKYRNADNYTRRMTQNKQLSDAQLDRSWQQHLRSTSGADDLSTFIDLQNTTNEAAADKAHIDNIYNDLRKGKATQETQRRYGQATATEMARRAYSAAEKQNATAVHKYQGDQEVIKEINSQLLSNGAYTDAMGVVHYRQVYGQKLQDYATGIGNVKRMLATEVEKDRKIQAQESGAAAELMKHFNLAASDFEALATDANRTISRTDSNNNTIDFSFSDIDARVAAIEWIAKNGAYSQKRKLALTSSDPNTNAELSGYIQRELASNGFGSMAPWANDKTNDDLSQGRITGMDKIYFHDFREIQEGRLQGEKLMSANATALEELFETYNHRMNTAGPEWQGYLNDQEAMLTREMQNSGKTPAQINQAVTEFRRDIDERYTAKYYDLMTETRNILDDPQLSARLNPQSKAEMEKAVGTFFSSGLGQQQHTYRQAIEAAQAAARNGTITAAQQNMLQRFYQIYK